MYLFKSFQEIIKNEQKKDYFQNEIIAKLDIEYKNNKIIFPDKNKIYRSMALCKWENLKIVIIGQDPYHGENEADGLAFSTQSSKLPPSLKNIYKEIKNSYPEKQFLNGDLTHWAKQGILLLNRSLTVEKDQPNSHLHINWHKFTENIIKTVANQKNNIIFLLLGKNAQSLKQHIDIKKHIIIELSHPSPFSARISFLNSHVFLKINKILKSMNKKEIDW